MITKFTTERQDVNSFENKNKFGVTNYFKPNSLFAPFIKKTNEINVVKNKFIINENTSLERQAHYISFNPDPCHLQTTNKQIVTIAHIQTLSMG